MEVSVTYNNSKYIDCDYIMKNAPIYAKGARSTRDLIRKKEIKASSQKKY